MYFPFTLIDQIWQNKNINYASSVQKGLDLKSGKKLGWSS